MDHLLSMEFNESRKTFFFRILLRYISKNSGGKLQILTLFTWF